MALEGACPTMRKPSIVHSSVDASDIAIDFARDDDREWAARLMAGTEPWLTLGRDLTQTRAVFARSDGTLFVARTGNTPLGFLLFRERGVVNSPYVASLAVEEHARGLGIGTRLLADAEDHARRLDAHLFIFVSSFNTRAKALYERLGYVVIGELKDYVIQGASEVLLCKRVR